MSIGFTEILLILFVVLILFGAKRLPELARSIGKAVSEFKKGLNEIKSDVEHSDAEPAKNADINADANAAKGGQRRKENRGNGKVN